MKSENYKNILRKQKIYNEIHFKVGISDNMQNNFGNCECINSQKKAIIRDAMKQSIDKEEDELNVLFEEIELSKRYKLPNSITDNMENAHILSKGINLNLKKNIINDIDLIPSCDNDIIIA